MDISKDEFVSHSDLGAYKIFNYQQDCLLHSKPVEVPNKQLYPNMNTASVPVGYLKCYVATFSPSG
jgi:hypothetical protein